MGKGEVAAIIVAAGRSARMGFDKLLHPLAGRPVLWHTIHAFDTHPGIHRLVVVAGENKDEIEAMLAAWPPHKPVALVVGGAFRAASVRAGLVACEGAEWVAIHDGARPFVSADVISRSLQAAAETGAAAPALPVKDTTKRAGEDGLVEATVPRQGLWAVQTPQVFRLADFTAAFAALPEGEWPALTDDCMVMERAGRPVRLVQGEVANIKITTPEDMAMAEEKLQKRLPRVGHGYDVHRLVEGRPLILGGVDIPFEKGLLGHSDADVLLHAVSDALLGAAALGDIGTHFPDTDPAFAGADSLELLKQVAQKLAQAGFAPASLDATLLCQRPRLAPHIPAMRANIAAALGLAEAQVNVKATTEEGLGFTGAGEGIAAHCVAVVCPHGGALPKG